MSIGVDMSTRNLKPRDVLRPEASQSSVPKSSEPILTSAPVHWDNHVDFWLSTQWNLLWARYRGKDVSLPSCLDPKLDEKAI